MHCSWCVLDCGEAHCVGLSVKASPNLIGRLVMKRILRPVGVAVMLMKLTSLPKVPGIVMRPTAFIFCKARTNPWFCPFWNACTRSSRSSGVENS